MKTEETKTKKKKAKTTEAKKSSKKKNSEIIEELEKKLAESEQAKKEIEDKWLRAAAEFENMKRRTQEEKVNWIKSATERIVLDLCDIVDNFERAMQTANAEHQFESFFKGIEMIQKQFESILEKEGVAKIDALDKDFDPFYHEALMQTPSEKVEKDKVAMIIQNGYIMNKKVIRPAKVAVSSGPNEENNKDK